MWIHSIITKFIFILFYNKIELHNQKFTQYIRFIKEIIFNHLYKEIKFYNIFESPNNATKIDFFILTKEELYEYNPINNKNLR